VNGIAIGPKDVDGMARAIVSLAMYAKHRLRLASGARATARALDWQHELDRLDASYREVLERQRPAKYYEARYA
jgi:glycosyltransferase involved in cell wall biosynthesis